MFMLPVHVDIANSEAFLKINLSSLIFISCQHVSPEMRVIICIPNLGVL